MSSSPQLEDGYTRIANELYEAVLRFDFTQRQLKLVLAVIRKTYGYGKKEDDMSASQLGEMCGMARTHVTATLTQLAAMNVIAKRPGRFGCIVGIQKNQERWIAAPVKACREMGTVDASDNTNSVQCTDLVHVPIQYADSTNSVQVDSTNSVHTKENLPKETKQKKPASKDITFSTWLTKCEEEGLTPIPSDHSVFSYAERISLPREFVVLAWLKFKERYSDDQKKYKAWATVFGTAVKENWYRLWFEKDGAWALTTAGVQLQREHA
jgi:phage replication O-like protein O